MLVSPTFAPGPGPPHSGMLNTDALGARVQKRVIPGSACSEIRGFTRSPTFLGRTIACATVQTRWWQSDRCGPVDTRRRILLVDDDAQIRRLVRRVLPEYEIVEAENGFAGYVLAKEQDFALIITDLQMPHMSGLELVRLLHEFTQPPPVVVFATLPEYQHRVELKRLGAEFVVKQGPLHGLQQRVRSLMRVIE